MATHGDGARAAAKPISRRTSVAAEEDECPQISQIIADDEDAEVLPPASSSSVIIREV
jgi:hypothetical protein